MRGTTVSLGNPPRILLKDKGGRLCALANQRGWCRPAQIAAGLGVSPANVSRLLNGFQAPGEIFIAAVLAAFPKAKFEDLFEVVPEHVARQRLKEQPRAA